ncbi:GSCOCT00000249001.3-RA-CDS, partial [Cotesia congregata]
LRADETLKSLGIAINIQGEFCFALKVAIFWIIYSVVICPVVTLYNFKNLIDLITKTAVIVVVYHGYFVSLRVHLELGKLCRITTTVYGTPLAFTTIGFFVNIIGSLYCQYLGLIKENSNIYEIMLSIVITLIWIVPFCLSFVSVNYICKETVNEWKQTGVILDELELESKNTEIQTEIRNFSAQVQRNTLKFSPCGFFDLDFYFVRDVSLILTIIPNNNNKIFFFSLLQRWLRT